VRATPAFFLEGAPLDVPFGLESLHRGVAAAVAAAEASRS
jgi:hypothetical protein